MLANQTKDNLLRVQAEIRNLSTTVDTLATEMKEDCQAQKKAATAASKQPSKTAGSIGENVASALMKDNAVLVKVTSDINLCLKELLKL